MRHALWLVFSSNPRTCCVSSVHGGLFPRLGTNRPKRITRLQLSWPKKYIWVLGPEVSVFTSPERDCRIGSAQAPLVNLFTGHHLRVGRQDSSLPRRTDCRATLRYPSTRIERTRPPTIGGISSITILYNVPVQRVCLWIELALVVRSLILPPRRIDVASFLRGKEAQGIVDFVD